MGINEKLESISGGLSFLLPELFLVAILILLIVGDLVAKKSGILKAGITALSGFSLLLLLGLDAPQSQVIINDMVQIGAIGWIFKLLLSVMLLLMGISGLINQSAEESRGEYYTLLVAITLGGFFLLSSKHLLIFYVAIELISISSYILTTFSQNKAGYEGGLKYLLFGAVSSGVMLYGLSLLYGFTGTLLIDEMLAELIISKVSVLPVMLFLMGLLFKLSLFPMQIWTPSAYQGAPTMVAAFISISPKLAVVGFIIPFLSASSYFNVQWQMILSVVAILSVVIGNFSALWQSDAKRMLAYSSIAHSGFFLLGLVVQNDLATQAVIFYGMVYLLMNLGAFFLVKVFENVGVKEIEDFRGLGKKYWVLGVLMVIVMISLTGLPPTAGFTGKLLILTSFYELYIDSGDQFMLFVLLLAIFNAAVSLFYYLKIPYFMFFKGEIDTSSAKQTIRKSEIVWATFLILPLLIVFLRPEILINIINNIKLYN